MSTLVLSPVPGTPLIGIIYHPDPVFFSSRCGQISVDGATVPSLVLRDAGDDYYSSSVAAGVEFAKMNNLLGIFFDSGLLVIVHPRFYDSARPLTEPNM